MNRRGFLTGVAGLLAAPAIVRVSSLMPISVQPDPMPYLGLAPYKAEFAVIGESQRFIFAGHYSGKMLLLERPL